MLNATKSGIIIEMNHIDNANYLTDALTKLKEFCGYGGDAELFVKTNGELHSCGFIGHDVNIIKVTHKIGTTNINKREKARCGAHLHG